MNLQLILALIGAVPYVIAGIQQIHGETKAGADKKTLAFEALGLAGSTAGAFFTGQNAQTVAVVTDLVGNSIDTWATAFKNQGVFGFKPSTPAPPALTPNPTPAAPLTGAAV